METAHRLTAGVPGVCCRRKGWGSDGPFGNHWKATVAAAAGLGVVIAILGPTIWQGNAGQNTTVRVVSPGTASVGSTVAVEIRVENVANLGTYEWFLTYDPNVLGAGWQNPANGDFLGTSGRSRQCPGRS